MADEQRIPLVNPDGQLVTLPASQVQDALKFGYATATPEQAEESAKQQQYGEGFGNELRAGAEGAARGLTFGLSDAALAAMGDKEGVAERKARNPLSAATGEIAGVGAGLLAPIGFAGAGVRGAAGLGELASEGAARGAAALGLDGAETLAGRALASAAKHGVAGATEGALYGAGQGISEAALGDPEDAAQTILAHATMGALLGGGIGGASGVLGEVGNSALKTLAAPSAAGMAPSWRVQGMAKVGSVLSGADEGALTDLLDFNSAEGMKMRQAAFVDPAVDDVSIRSLTKHIQSAESDAMPVLEQARGKLKDEHIAKIVRRDNVNEQADAAYQALAQMQNAVEEMQGRNELYGYKTGVKKLEEAIGDTATRIDDALASENPSGKMFAAMDDLKANLGRITKRKRGISYSDKDFASFDLMEDLYKGDGGIQKMLEDQGLWGQAGELQSRMNQKWTSLLENNKQFRAEFMKEIGEKDWETQYAANPAAVESFLGSVGRARNDLRQELLQSHMRKIADFAREARDAYELGGDFAGKVDNIGAAAQGANEEIADALKTAGIRNEARKILETRGGRSLAQLAKLEHTVRFKLGITADNVAAQQATARAAQIGNMQQAQANVYRRIDKSVDRLAAKLLEAPKIAVPATVKAYHEIRWAPRERLKKQEMAENPYDDRLTELANLAANPAMLQQRLAASVGDLSKYAPRVATEMQYTTAQAVNYLYNLAPKNPYGDAPASIRRAWKPSAIQIQPFAAAMAAIHDPVGVIRDMENGHVSKDAVDALRAVYPHLYGRVVQRLVPKIAEAEDMPIQRRLEMANVLGVSLDSLTSPGASAAWQAMYAKAAQKPAPPARPSVSKNIRAKQSMTALQRVMEDDS